MPTFRLVVFYSAILMGTFALLRGRLIVGKLVSVPTRGRAALLLIFSIACFLSQVICVDFEKIDFATGRPVAKRSGLRTGARPITLSRFNAGESADRAGVKLLPDRGTRRAGSRVVHPELFGPVEYGMTLDEIMQVLPKGRGVQVEYIGDKSVTLHWSTTMWGEFAKVHLQMMGNGGTLNSVVVVIDNCEKTIVRPGGVTLSTECQEITMRIARYLEERYGAPRKEREPYAEGDGYLEKTIWMSPTSEIYFVFTKSVEQDGANRFEVNTAPLLVFEPQK